MKFWSILLAAIVGLVLCVACGGGGGEMVKAQEDFAEKACACKDLDCVKAVQAEQTTWVTQHGQAAMGNESDMAKIEEANKKLSECIQKLVQQAAAGQ